MIDDLAEVYAVVRASRSPEYNRRAAAHEGGGHAAVGRALGSFIEYVTILPGDGYAGRCVRRGAPSASLNLLNEKTEAAITVEVPITVKEPTPADLVAVCANIGAPEVGTARVDLCEEIVRAQTHIIELLAGSVCERVMFPDLPPLPAEHDRIEARALASVICASPAAIDALLAYAEAEARALIEANLDVAEALTDALVEKGTLLGDEVDAIISACVARRGLALEYERRSRWKAVTARASTFEANRG
jgi:hypothetical protein